MLNKETEPEDLDPGVEPTDFECELTATSTEEDAEMENQLEESTLQNEAPEKSPNTTGMEHPGLDMQPDPEERHHLALLGMQTQPVKTGDTAGQSAKNAHKKGKVTSDGPSTLE